VSDLPLVDRIVTSSLSRVAFAAIVLLLAAAGCSAQQQSATGSLIRVSERDFRISVPREVAAGDAVIRVHNHGPDEHELIVVKTGDGRLPLRNDGLTVDEDAVQKNEVGALEPGAPNSVRELHVKLTPGRYVLLCNMSGHYMGGMHATLVVR
jgi:plastocyanin